MNNEEVNIYSDLEKDYNKLNQDIKKKYTVIHESINKALNLIQTLKNQKEKKKIQEFNNLLDPIRLIITKKKSKHILQCLIIIKRIIELNIVNENFFCEILQILKTIIDDIYSDDYTLKIIEIIQSSLLSTDFSITLNNINIIYKICLFLFSNKNQIYKTSSKYIFKTLNDKIIQNSNKEILIQYLKILISLFDEKNIYSKCLGIELMIQILNNLPDNLITEEFKSLIENDVSNNILKMFNDNISYILGVKLCRLAIILIIKYKSNNDFMKIFITYAFYSKTIWQKQIGLESICSLLKSSDIIYNLFQFKRDYIKEIFDKIKEVTYNIEDKKDVNKNRMSLKKKMSIENDIIILDSDEIINHNIENIEYIKKLILDCLNNIKNAFVKIMKDKEILINQLNFNLSPEQFNIRNMLNFNYEPIRDSLFYILIKSNNDLISFKVLNVINIMMEIYSSICLPIIRDDYLKKLCNEVFDNNKELNQKKILIVYTLISFVHNIKLLESKSFIYLLDTFEQINSKVKNISNKSSFKEFLNVDIIVNDIIKRNKNNINDSNNNSNNNDINININFFKQETEDYINSINIDLIMIFIDNLFIDSYLYDNEVICNIIEALSKLIKSSLDKKNEYKIFFYMNKLLIITLSNLTKAEIIYTKVIEIIENISNNNLPEITLYCLDIISTLINQFLQNYKIKNNLDSNYNESWSKENWQRTIFSPYLQIVNQRITKEKVDKIIENLHKIIQISGEKMDTFGWASFIEICSILLNTNSDKTFNLIKQTLNDYKVYLSPFNIIPMLSLLGSFALYDNNRNICFNAIDLFWSCADITENFQCGKIKLTDVQKEIFEDLKKNQQSPDLLFQEIWRQIFFKLTNINSDFRADVRKSGINVFTDIFITKYHNISHSYKKVVINEIFFKVFTTNLNIYKEKMNLNDKDIENEWEENALISLFSIVKIIKVFINDNDQSLDEKKIIFKSLIDNIILVISNSSPDFIVEILKSILDIQLKDYSYFIINDINLFWDYINSISNYLLSENYKKKYITSITTGKIIENIIKYFKLIFLNNEDLVNKENIEKCLNILSNLFSVLYIYDNNKINQNPQKLFNLENDIFNFIESISNQSKSQEIILILYEYIFNYCKYDYLNPHTYALFIRAILTIKIIFSNKNFQYEKILFNFIDKIKVFILSRNQNEIIESLIQSNKKNKNNNQLLFQNIISEFLDIMTIIINENNNNEEIWLKLIEFFESIFRQSLIGFCSVHRIYQQDLIKCSVDIEIQIINFNVNILIPKSFYLSESIQSKLLNLLDLGCNLEYSSYNNNLFEIRKICILNLFDLCQYHTESEIKRLNQDKINEENFEHFIKIKIKISKMCTPILIKRLEGVLKKFLEDEMKSGDMPLSRNRINEMKEILEKIKNLDLYPDFMSEFNEKKNNNNLFINNNKNEKNNINNNKNDDKKINNINNNNINNDNYNNNSIENKNINNITILDVISKSKKIHLFFLQPILSDFILTKEKEIKILIRDIFQEISKCIGLSEIKFFK